MCLLERLDSTVQNDHGNFDMHIWRSFATTRRDHWPKVCHVPINSLVSIEAQGLLSSSNGMSQDAQPDGASSIPACATFSGVGQGGGGYLEGFFKARCPGGQGVKVDNVPGWSKFQGDPNVKVARVSG